MISSNLINKKIWDYEHSIDNINNNEVQKAKIDILYWANPDNTVRSEDEIKNKIKRLKEELFAISNSYDIQYQCKTAKIHELESLIK